MKPPARHTGTMADDSHPDLPSDDELRERLTAEQYEVTQKGGTERAFSGAYWNTKDPGTYRCVVCDAELFRSDTKYDSGSGWPSFTEPTAGDAVRLLTDSSHGMDRTEVRCARCDAHLGHVFPDGPGPTRERYCMNSASLALEPDAP
jgi:peptide-methionine (R)-S-oxide reductase